MSELKIRASVEDNASDALKQIGEAGKTMADDLKASSEIGDELSEGFEKAGEGAKGMGESFEAAGESASGMADSMGGVGESLGTVGESATEAGEGVGTMGESLTTAGESATEMGDSMTTMGESLATAGEEATTTGDELTTMGEALTTTGEEATTTGDNLDTMGESLGTAGEEAQTAGDDIETMGESLETTGDQAETTGDDFDTMGEGLETAAGAAETTGGAMDTMGESLDTAGGSAETAGGNLDTMGEAATTAGDNASTASGEVDTLGDSADTAGESAGTASGSLDTLADSSSTAGDNAATAEGEISGMGDSADTAGESAGTAAGSVDTLGESSSTAGDNASTAGEEISGMGDAADTAGESAGTAAGSLDTMGESASTAGGELDSAGASADTAASSIGDAESAAGGADIQMGALTFTAAQLSTDIESVGTSSDTSAGQVDNLATSVSTADGIFAGAGTAAGDFSANLDAVGGSADAAVGGLTESNTLIGDVGETSRTSGEKITGMTGTITAMGATVGTTISTVYRFQDAQLALDKANLKLEKSTEAARKAGIAFDTLLGKAKTNNDNIAAATDTYAAALDNLNQLQDAGISSGTEYEQAQADLAAAVADLKAEFVAGGGDANKFDAALNKVKLTTESAELAIRTNEKAQRTFNQTMLDGGLNAVALAGNLTTMVSNSDKLKGAFDKLTGGATTLQGKLGAIGAEMYLVAAAFEAVQAAIKSTEAFQAIASGEMEQGAKKLKENWESAKSSITPAGGIIAGISAIAKAFGFDVEEAFDKGVKKGADLDKTNKDVKTSQEDVGKVTADLTSRFTEQETEIRKNVETSTEMAAAYQKIIGPTTDLTSGLTTYAEAVKNLTQDDVDSVAQLEKRHRSLIEQASGVNNAELAEIQYQQALTAMTASLVADTDQKNANARATLTLADSTVNAQNAIATVNEAYANSVDRLADLNTVMTDSDATTKAITTAVNEYHASLLEEEIALRASIVATNDGVIARQALDNAYLKGIESVDKWALGVATAREEEQGMIDRLAEMGLTMEKLPPTMEPTIENLQKMKEAMELGGQAAIDFSQEVMESFDRFTGEIPGKLDELVGIVQKGGENLSEETGKWFADLEGTLGRNLDPAEQKFIESFKNMKLEGETALANMNFEAFKGNLQGGMDSAEQIFRDFASTSDGVFSEIATSMANILATGSEQAVAEATEAFNSDAPPDALLEHLRKIETEAPNIVKEASNKSMEEMATILETSPQVDSALEALGLKVAEKGEPMGTELGTQFETAAAAKFGEAWLTIGEALKVFLDSIGPYISDTTGPQILEAFTGVSTEIATTFQTNAMDPILQNSLPLFIEGWTMIGEGMTEFWGKLATDFQELAMQPILDNSLPLFVEGWTLIGEGMVEFWTKFATDFQELAMQPILDDSLPLFVEGWTMIGEGLVELFGKFATDYDAKAMKPMTTATNKFSTDVTTQMKTKFGEAFGDINTKANTTIQTMQQKFQSAIDQITSQMKSKFGEAFGDINTKADTSARNFEQKFDDATNQATAKIESDFASSFTTVEGDAQAAANSMEQDFMSAIDSIRSAFESMISSMESQISALESRARSIPTGGGGVGGGGGGGGGGGLFGQHGLHTTLDKDTTIFAHRGERVDIFPKGSIKPGPRALPPIAMGGGQPFNINLNVSQQVDGKEFSRLMGRYTMEGYSGA